MTIHSSPPRPSAPAPTAELKAERAAFYAAIEPEGLGALWNVLSSLLTPEPGVRSLPALWKWRDLRPRVLRSGELVTADEAERRVLYFLNPGLPRERSAITNTLYAGVQLILPGEIARSHHHTPSAIRFIIEGEGGYTAVSGEQSIMRKGDFLTTPNWTWHDHGNRSDAPVLWLDGLDLPFVTAMDAVFFEELPPTAAGPQVQPVTRPLEDSTFRWGSNLRPAWQQPPAGHTPVVNYRWDTSRRALDALRRDEGSPFDGIILEYINPQTGGSALPTMSAYLQLLRAAEHTRAHRHVASTVYHVAEGGGWSVIAGQRFDWEVGDTFVVPAWAWHEHASQSGEAVLFSFSDRPVLRALGLEREQGLDRGHQEQIA